MTAMLYQDHQPHPWFEHPIRCARCNQMHWWPVANEPTKDPVLCADCLNAVCYA